MTEGINYRRKAQNQKRELALLNKKCAQQQAENNRQKAEIEKIQLSRKQKIKEIERLKKGWKADVIETQNIKVEAIKEFADRLKKQFKEDINDIQDSITRITDPDAIDGQYETIAAFELSLDYIDNLVKEMVGEQE